MTIPDSHQQKDAQQRIDDYLTRLRKCLRGTNAEEAREIVEELRSHIVESASAQGGLTIAAVDAALAKLGSAEELANQYITDALLARAEVSRSPLHVLDSLFHWGTLSIAGFLVLLLTIAGDFLGISFITCAASKLFHPHSAGLWVIPNSSGDSEISLRLGLRSAPASGHELLGWWIVPLGLLAGCALIMLTMRFALWCVRQYRKSRALPSRP